MIRCECGKVIDLDFIGCSEVFVDGNKYFCDEECHSRVGNKF